MQEPVNSSQKPTGRLQHLITRYGAGSIEQIMVAMLNFGIVIACGRLLAASDFAIFVVIMAALSLAFALSNSFVAVPVLVLFRKRYQQGHQSYRRHLSLINLFATPPVGIVALGISYLAENRITWSAGIAALLLLQTWSGYDLRRKLSYAAGSVSTLVICSIMVLAASVLMVGGLFFANHLDLVTILLALAASYGLGILMTHLLIPSSTDSETMGLQDVCKDHWMFSRSITLSILFYWAASQGYFLIAAKYLSDQEIGGARTAQNLVGLIAMVVTIFENHAMPVAADIEQRGGRSAVRDYVDAKLRVLAAPFLGLVIASAVAGYFVHSILYRKDYAPYSYLIFAFALQQLLLGLSRLYSIGLKAIEDNKPVFWGHLIGALLMITAGPFIISHFKALGVSIGFVLSTTVMVVILYTSFNKASSAAKQAVI